MIRQLVIACVVALGLFAVLEFSYRLIIIGPEALNPTTANSYTTLMASQHIRPSEYPSVYYELKPNLDVMLRGVPLRTNSQGLADREYSIEKPPNTYRIAVVGSSWTMPASVQPEEAYHVILEDALNARSTGVNYEVINFGVEQYGLGEIVGTIEHRVLPYKPDMLIFAMTPFTAKIKWLEHAAPFQPPAFEPPVFQSMVLLQLGIGNTPVDKGLSPQVLDYTGEERYLAQIPAALYRAKQLCDKNDIDMVYLFLAFRPWYPKTASLMEHTLANLNIPLVDIPTVLYDGVTDYKVSEADAHPNPLAHTVISSTLIDYLESQLELKPN